MCKKIMTIIISAAILTAFTACNVTVKDYSSDAEATKSDNVQSGAASTSSSLGTTDDEKVIGYDIYRPGDDESGDTQSAVSSASSASSASSSAASASSGTSSSKTSSSDASSKGTSSGTTSSKSNSSSASSKGDTSSAASSKASSNEESSYYDDWADDNVIDFSELLG